jgi:hypothetical protein
MVPESPIMKSLSSSIIVLSGAMMITFGSHISHNDTKLFVQFVGSAVGSLGLWQWWKWIQSDSSSG